MKLQARTVRAKRTTCPLLDRVLDTGLARQLIAEPKTLWFPGVCGAGERIRTSDLLITNQLLYRLSYSGVRRGSIKRRRFRKQK